ncbi:MAG TPA: hypothetical protein VM582_00190, partial [Candidatus Thermoplasmatota archaeon]|nr:hypothetical protein [Candidatus Thermoplasmatota archaeon]
MSHDVVAALPPFAAAAVTVALAAVVARRGFERRMHQALVMLLLCFAGIALAAGMMFYHLSGLPVERTAESAPWERLQWHLYSVAFLLILLLTLLTSPQASRLPGWAQQPLVWMAAAAPLSVAYALDHDALTGGGVFTILFYGLALAAGATAFVFYRRARRARSSAERDQHLLLGTGMVLYNIYEARRIAFLAVELATELPPASRVLDYLLNGATLLTGLLFPPLVLWRAWRERAGGGGGYARAGAIGGIVLLAATVDSALVLRSWLTGAPIPPTLIILLRTVFGIALASGVLAYAVLRTGVPGLDVRVRRGVRGGTIAA